MKDNQNYIPKNQLRKDSFRLFKKWFSNLKDNLKIRLPIMHPNNFWFSVSAENSDFGDIIVEIADQDNNILHGL